MEGGASGSGVWHHSGSGWSGGGSGCYGGDGGGSGWPGGGGGGSGWSGGDGEWEWSSGGGEWSSGGWRSKRWHDYSSDDEEFKDGSITDKPDTTNPTDAKAAQKLTLIHFLPLSRSSRFRCRGA